MLLSGTTKGLVIASLSQQMPHAYQAVEIDKAIVEGNSELVVKALIKEDTDLACYGLLILNACNYASSFSKLSYSRFKRENNKVAHSLIRLAINFSNYVVWMKDVPPQVYSVIQADLVIVS